MAAVIAVVIAMTAVADSIPVDHVVVSEMTAVVTVVVTLVMVAASIPVDLVVHTMDLRDLVAVVAGVVMMALQLVADIRLIALLALKADILPTELRALKVATLLAHRQVLRAALAAVVSTGHVIAVQAEDHVSLATKAERNLVRLSDVQKEKNSFYFKELKNGKPQLKSWGFFLEIK